MKLYYSPGACSLSPHIVLREAGLQFDLEHVDLQTKKTKAGVDFTTVTPKGQVPVLVLDNGEKLTEGPVVVQYIADQKPESGLMPQPGSFDRYRVQEWLNFITSELHQNFNPLFDPAVPGEYKKMAKEGLGKRFDMLDQQLTKQQYLSGSKFTAADAYAFVVISWSKHLGIDLARWPNLSAYLSRIAARPKVRDAIQAEGLA